MYLLIDKLNKMYTKITEFTLVKLEIAQNFKVDFFGDLTKEKQEEFRSMFYNKIEKHLAINVKTKKLDTDDFYSHNWFLTSNHQSYEMKRSFKNTLISNKDFKLKNNTNQYINKNSFHFKDDDQYIEIYTIEKPEFLKSVFKDQLTLIAEKDINRYYICFEQKKILQDKAIDCESIINFTVDTMKILLDLYGYPVL